MPCRARVSQEGYGKILTAKSLEVKILKTKKLRDANPLSNTPSGSAMIAHTARQRQGWMSHSDVERCGKLLGGPMPVFTGTGVWINAQACQKKSAHPSWEQVRILLRNAAAGVWAPGTPPLVSVVRIVVRIKESSVPTASLPTRFIRVQKSILIIAAAMAAVLILSSASVADSCPAVITLTNSNPQAPCVVPETNPELPMTVSLKYSAFTSAAQGVVLIYDDAAHTILSDVVTFSNLNGLATAVFTSDSNGTASVPPGLPA